MSGQIHWGLYVLLYVCMRCRYVDDGNGRAFARYFVKWFAFALSPCGAQYRSWRYYLCDLYISLYMMCISSASMICCRFLVYISRFKLSKALLISSSSRCRECSLDDQFACNYVLSCWFLCSICCLCRCYFVIDCSCFGGKSTSFWDFCKLLNFNTTTYLKNFVNI